MDADVLELLRLIRVDVDDVVISVRVNATAARRDGAQLARNESSQSEPIMIAIGVDCRDSLVNLLVGVAGVHGIIGVRHIAAQLFLDFIVLFD